MHDIFNSTRSYASNSLQDLLDAREQYHFQLMNKDNVVATAIGYYRIRKTDPWPTASEPNKALKKVNSGPRTLLNSEVRPYSWPSVLVFVNKWMSDKEIYDVEPTSIVPKILLLKDGRKIPVCVIYAPLQSKTDDSVVEEKLQFPRNLISGGFPLLVEIQNEQRIASAGCLVTDGHITYVLTNKHVAGEEGTPIYSRLAGEYKVIGVSSKLNAGRFPFRKVYKKWGGKNTYINVDIGLIEINDLNQWSTEVYGIGPMGKLADLHTGNFTLNLIGAKVTGYGAVSGPIDGEIQALFYRYKSVGGYEYLSDFLVGPSGDKPLALHAGDSGSVLMYKHEVPERETELMPIGVVWGQHEFIGTETKLAYPYALVNCLSMVLNMLGVDLVRGWNLDQPYIWGKVGHYEVGSLAVSYTSGDLNKLMSANITNISFKAGDISKTLAQKDNPRIQKDPTVGFCPLADVPDIIWKQSKQYVDKQGKKQGYKWGRKGDENPNHYADADYKTEEGNLYQICDAPEKLNTKTWKHYYELVDEAMGKTGNAQTDGKRGLICFRVWQIFDYMVDAARKGNVAKFIFGGGVLAHYIGDACQPLHSSYMSDGDPADDEKIMYTPPRGGSRHPKGIPYEKIVNPGSGVHSAYEDAMIDAHIHQISPILIQRMTKSMKSATTRVEEANSITSGREAGFAILQLMKATQEEIPPKDIVEVYKKVKSLEDPAGKLYEEFGLQTINCLERGSRYLATVWNAAWNMPGNKIKKLTKVDETDLIKLYVNPNELPSKHLDAIDTIIHSV